MNRFSLGLQRFCGWFGSEPRGWKQIGRDLAYLLIMLLGVTGGFNNLLYRLSIHTPLNALITPKHVTWDFVFTVFIAAPWEELPFRFLPLFLIVRFFKRWWSVTLVTLLCAGAYTWIHSEGDMDLVAGLSAIVLSYTFLKCGGWDRHWRKATLCILCLHLANNVVAFLVS